MRIITFPHEMQQWALQQRYKGKKIAFVPTMGFLHQGHLSLVDIAKKHADIVVASIYVNPTQFAPSEDLSIYPRDLERDKKLLKGRGVHLVFIPDNKDIYSGNHNTYVVVENLTKTLCGKSRPMHFRGVATIVTKLFNIIQPHVAVFGQKDAQQLAVIRQMVRDLNMPVKIISGEIIREKDGLAMSSRNVFLSQQERKDALVINQSLQKARQAYAKGERDSAKLESLIKDLIMQTSLAKIDYVSIVGKEDMRHLDRIGDSNALAAVAVYFGKTRLIDNAIFDNGI